MGKNLGVSTRPTNRPAGSGYPGKRLCILAAVSSQQGRPAQGVWVERRRLVWASLCWRRTPGETARDEHPGNRGASPEALALKPSSQVHWAQERREGPIPVRSREAPRIQPRDRAASVGRPRVGAGTVQTEVSAGMAKPRGLRCAPPELPETTDEAGTGGGGLSPAWCRQAGPRPSASPLLCTYTLNPAWPEWLSLQGCSVSRSISPG